MKTGTSDGDACTEVDKATSARSAAAQQPNFIVDDYNFFCFWTWGHEPVDGPESFEKRFLFCSSRANSKMGLVTDSADAMMMMTAGCVL